jgi:hypothetical protein
MATLVKNMLGGLAGSIILNTVHQLVKKMDKDAPRLDKVGEEAVSKSINAAGYNPPKGQKLFYTALLSDVVANTIYYSLIGKGKKENLLLRGLIFGSLAGIGALTLTKPMGLHDRPVNKTTKTKVITVGLYILGAIATAYSLKLIKKEPAVV